MSHHKNHEAETSDTHQETQLQSQEAGIRDRAREFISSTKQHRHGSNYKIILVDPEDVEHIWENVSLHLDMAMKHSEGEMSAMDFYPYLMEGQMQLWVAVVDGDVDASMITQIIPYPRKKVLRIISIAGENMEDWIGFLPLIEGWALSMGCTSLECWGRKGWLKVLQDWKCSYHIITKDLTDRMH